ncbi:NAD(P)-binding protein [Rhodofomes roseus]|uniref:NAD(P)-binding protein n=1 Tax=Rhodofomes roseus TaxID=34475 RepID=A0ABQ8K7H6_9APHY|nr:NAD(P)-binding protein [Rhodofomes roseus]KAH9833153.1 NAD(P)-binding protein [Rhodofomes roseus]
MGFVYELKMALKAMGDMRAPKPTFSTDQIPDLTGRVMIVTGGNTGIGKETIKVLLQHNAKVYMASRSPQKAEAAIAELKEETGKEAVFLELDLTSYASIHKAAEEFLSKEENLHVLFNNAGLMLCPIDMLGPEDYDLQWFTNVVGPFLFTKLLLPALIAGKASSPDGHTRIIATSSSGSYLGIIHWDTLKDGPARRKTNSQELYFQSKFANVVVTRQLAKRYADQGIIAVSLNPGNISTDLQRYMSGIQKRIIATLLQPVQLGALTQLWAGTMPGALELNGGYLIPWARVGSCRREAYDDALGEKLWEWLENAVNDK